MVHGDTSALRDAIELAMRIIRRADEIVREYPGVSRSELIERLSEIFLDNEVAGYAVESWRRK
ncbi:hypothetical protein WME91_43465 [Sorangium sp. So ce269]